MTRDNRERRFDMIRLHTDIHSMGTYVLSLELLGQLCHKEALEEFW